MKLPAHLLQAMRFGGGVVVALGVGCRAAPHETVTADPPVATTTTVTASPSSSTQDEATKTWVVETKTMGMSAPPPGDFTATAVTAPSSAKKAIVPAKAPPPKVKPPGHECLACGMG